MNEKSPPTKRGSKICIFGRHFSSIAYGCWFRLRTSSVAKRKMRQVCRRTEKWSANCSIIFVRSQIRTIRLFFQAKHSFVAKETAAVGRRKLNARDQKGGKLQDEQVTQGIDGAKFAIWMRRLILAYNFSKIIREGLMGDIFLWKLIFPFNSMIFFFI